MKRRAGEEMVGMSASVATRVVIGVDGARTEAQPRSRVVLAGFETPSAQHIASELASAGARLMLQANATPDSVAAAAGRIAAQAPSVSLVARPLAGQDDAQALMQAAVRALGGVDTLITVLELTAADLAEVAAAEDIEHALAGLIAGPLSATRIAGNRMALTWTRGTIINVLVMPADGSPRANLIGQLVKSALAALTRAEADRLAEHEIRAVTVAASRGEATSACIPEVAALLRELSSADAPDLSGVVYEAVLTV